MSVTSFSGVSCECCKAASVERVMNVTSCFGLVVLEQVMNVTSCSVASLGCH